LLLLLLLLQLSMLPLLLDSRFKPIISPLATCSSCFFFVVVQVGTLWVAPQEVPGCTFDRNAAYVP
jgi:hypothetical protein